MPSSTRLTNRTRSSWPFGIAIAYGSLSSGWPRRARVGLLLLGLEALEDGVVARDGVDLTVLERHQAVGAGVDRVDLRRRDPLLDLRDRRGTAGRADRLPREGGHAVHRGTDGNEHVLVGLVVDGREVDVVPPVARRGEEAGHHVDLARLHRLDPLGRGQRLELQVHVVGVAAEDGQRDLTQDVDVEARDGPVARVAVAPVQRALVDAHHELLAFPVPDGIDRRGGQGGVGREALAGVARRGRRSGRGRRRRRRGGGIGQRAERPGDRAVRRRRARRQTDEHDRRGRDDRPPAGAHDATFRVSSPRGDGHRHRGQRLAGTAVERSQPPFVEARQGAVVAQPVQDPVDVPHERDVLRTHCDAVVLQISLRDDAQPGVLVDHADEEGVVAEVGVHLALLQRDQAVGAGVDQPRHRRWLQPNAR